jgi:hypothetical protein
LKETLPPWQEHGYRQRKGKHNRKLEERVEAQLLDMFFTAIITTAIFFLFLFFHKL